jgi:hypothetical protein
MWGIRYPRDMYVIAVLAVIVGMIHSFVATPFLPGLDIPLIVLPLLFVLVRRRPMYIVFASFLGFRAFFAYAQIWFPRYPGGKVFWPLFAAYAGMSFYLCVRYRIFRRRTADENPLEGDGDLR